MSVSGFAFGDGATNTVQNTLTSTVPTVSAGDTLVVVASINGTTPVLSISGGNVSGGTWTVLSGPDTNGTTETSTVWIATATSTSTGATITISSDTNGRMVGAGAANIGFTPTGAVVAITKQTSASTSIPFPSVTVGTAGSQVLGLCALRINSTTTTTLTAPTGSTRVAQAASAFVSSAEFTDAVVAINATSSTGSVTPGTGTASSSVTNCNIYTVALAPATTNASGTINPSGGGTTALSSPAVIARASAGLSGGGTTTFTSAAKAATGSLGLSGTGVVSLGVAGGLSVGGVGGLSFSGIQVALSDSLFIAGDGGLTISQVFPTTIFKGVLAQRLVPLSGALVALMNYSKAVMRINGEWVEAEVPSQSQIDAADLYFPGGYETIVDHTTATLLTAAGYTVDSE